MALKQILFIFLVFSLIFSDRGENSEGGETEDSDDAEGSGTT